MAKNLATRIFVRRRDKVFGLSSGGGGGGGVTSVTGSLPITSSGGTTPNIAVNNATASTVGVVQPDNTTITISGGVISAVATAINFADDETPGGSNPNYTLAHTPSPAGSLTLFTQVSASFGWILLERGTDYTLSGSSITITMATFAGGALRAWYRY